MDKAPERIWAVPYVGIFGKGDAKGKYWADRLQAGVEYVRLDLYEQVKRELAYQEKVSSDRFERIERQAYAYDEMCIRAEAAERLAGARVKVKLLEWSEIRPPNEEVRYDHVVSASALGQWSIEWKSWKDYDDRTIFLDGDFVANGGENLEAAKAAAQADYERRIISALAEPAGEAEPVAWLRDIDGTGSLHPASKGDPGAFPVYTTPPDASAIREATEKAAQMAGDAFWSLPMPRHWDRDKREYSDWCAGQSKRIREKILALAGRAER